MRKEIRDNCFPSVDLCKVLQNVLWQRCLDACILTYIYCLEIFVCFRVIQYKMQYYSIWYCLPSKLQKCTRPYDKTSTAPSSRERRSCSWLLHSNCIERDSNPFSPLYRPSVLTKSATVPHRVVPMLPCFALTKYLLFGVVTMLCCPLRARGFKTLPEQKDALRILIHLWP